MGIEESPALQIVSCPVNTSDDFQQMNKEGLQNYPRAVIQLINKKPDPNAQLADNLSEDAALLIKAGQRFT